MTIAVADIDRRIGIVLHDTNRIRWTAAERLDWINDGAAEIVIRRPPARTVVETLTLTAGARHSIADGVLVDVLRNAGGRSISRVDRGELDALEPDWYSARAQSTVKHFCFDDRQPTVFYTYPPVVADTQVEVARAAAPPLVTTIDSDNLDLDRIYMGPLVSYVAYRALSKDSEYANGVQAATHFQAFQAAIGVRNESALLVGAKGPGNEGS